MKNQVAQLQSLFLIIVLYVYYIHRRAYGTVVDRAILECLIVEVPEGKSGVSEGSKGLIRPKLIKD